MAFCATVSKPRTCARRQAYPTDSMTFCFLWKDDQLWPTLPERPHALCCTLITAQFVYLIAGYEPRITSYARHIIEVQGIPRNPSYRQQLDSERCAWIADVSDSVQGIFRLMFGFCRHEKNFKRDAVGLGFAYQHVETNAESLSMSPKPSCVHPRVPEVSRDLTSLLWPLAAYLAPKRTWQLARCLLRFKMCQKLQNKDRTNSWRTFIFICNMRDHRKIPKMKFIFRKTYLRH